MILNTASAVFKKRPVKNALGYAEIYAVSNDLDPSSRRDDNIVSFRPTEGIFPDNDRANITDDLKFPGQVRSSFN